MSMIMKDVSELQSILFVNSWSVPYDSLVEKGKVTSFYYQGHGQNQKSVTTEGRSMVKFSSYVFRSVLLHPFNNKTTMNKVTDASASVCQYAVPSAISLFLSITILSSIVFVIVVVVVVCVIVVVAGDCARHK